MRKDKFLYVFSVHEDQQDGRGKTEQEKIDRKEERNHGDEDAKGFQRVDHSLFEIGKNRVLLIKSHIASLVDSLLSRR